MSTPRELKIFINGKWLESKTSDFVDCYDPSTGEVIAKAPHCTKSEVDNAVEAAKNAYVEWSETPPPKRVQVLFKMKELVVKHRDELVKILATENGKCLEEALGDVLKAEEVIDFACGIPQLLKGDALFNCSAEYDTVQYKEPVGVFAGLCPWNFPAMIPHGWMIPICIATGNTFILKPAIEVPQTSIKFMELWAEAGVPNGVINMITVSHVEAEYLVKHKDVNGITFVGSTSVGKHVYATAAEAGKRVQALCEAKNHALVLKDCNLDMTVKGIVNATYGCAGERCMALPVVVVEDSIADQLVEKLKAYAEQIKIGPAYEKNSKLGPLINKKHLEFVTKWIEKGVKEGADLILDGRDTKVEGAENGYYIGPSIFDNVKPGISIGDREVFGPVTCIKRVKDSEEGVKVMNDNPFANGSAIYTQSGYYAREFSKRTHGGMVGINVGIPVPVSIFGFTGHKNSFFGDLHVMGTDGVRFYTQLKSVTSHWFEEGTDREIDTWDGMLNK